MPEWGFYITVRNWIFFTGKKRVLRVYYLDQHRSDHVPGRDALLMRHGDRKTTKGGHSHPFAGPVLPTVAR
jgi:hypothetical protein